MLTWTSQRISGLWPLTMRAATATGGVGSSELDIIKPYIDPSPEERGEGGPHNTHRVEVPKLRSRNNAYWIQILRF